jgi:hypothetical protein
MKNKQPLLPTIEDKKCCTKCGTIVYAKNGVIQTKTISNVYVKEKAELAEIDVTCVCETVIEFKTVYSTLIREWFTKIKDQSIMNNDELNKLRRRNSELEDELAKLKKKKSNAGGGK